MPRSGIVALADAVRNYFEANSVPAQVARVGLKFRTFLTNQGPGGGSRIVFIPGDFDGSEGGRPTDEGTLGEPLKHTSDNPRELAEWARSITVSVWGVDAEHLDDEQAQIEATEALFELTVRAVHNARSPYDVPTVDASGHPITAVLGGLGVVVGDGKVTRVYPPIENPFGNELLWRFQLSGPLFDAPSIRVIPTLGPLSKSFSPPLPPTGT